MIFREDESTEQVPLLVSFYTRGVSDDGSMFYPVIQVNAVDEDPRGFDQASPYIRKVYDDDGDVDKTTPLSAQDSMYLMEVAGNTVQKSEDSRGEAILTLSVHMDLEEEVYETAYGTDSYWVPVIESATEGPELPDDALDLQLEVTRSIQNLRVKSEMQNHKMDNPWKRMRNSEELTVKPAFRDSQALPEYRYAMTPHRRRVLDRKRARSSRMISDDPELSL